MYRRGDMLWNIVLFVSLDVMFVVLMFFYIYDLRGAAHMSAQVYAQDLSRLINIAEPGDEFQINVHQASVIALRNEVGSLSEIFQFDNVGNEVCVKLSRGRAGCYSYFNDVDIVDSRIERIDVTQSVNVLRFRVVEKQRRSDVS